MESVTIILNCAAGHKQIKTHIEHIKQTLASHFSTVSVIETEQSGDGACWVEKHAQQTDLLIAAGGDGTVYEIINALCAQQNRPVFAILPGGTCNDFSRTIGMSQDPLEAINQITNKRLEKIDVGKAGSQYFLNFWGIGLITQVSADINPTIKKKFGRLSYYLSSAKHLRDTHPFHLKISGTSKTFEGQADMVIVGNGTFTAGTRSFFPESDVQDGLLDVFIMKETGLASLWDLLQAKITKHVNTNEGITYFQTDHLTIESVPAQKIDCDGERHDITPTHIIALPQHLRMFVGDL